MILKAGETWIGIFAEFTLATGPHKGAISIDLSKRTATLEIANRYPGGKEIVRDTTRNVEEWLPAKEIGETTGVCREQITDLYFVLPKKKHRLAGTCLPVPLPDWIHIVETPPEPR